MFGSLILFNNGGTFKCSLDGCGGAVIANKALKNHLVNFHGCIVEQAMKFINETKPEL